MLERTQVSSRNDEETTVLIAGALDEGFRHVAERCRGLMGKFGTPLFDVHCDEGQLPESCLALLRETVPCDPWVQTLNLQHNPFYLNKPRAHVQFSAVTWDSTRAGVPVSERGVSHSWTIVACPSGEDLRVFETAEMLMWDADAVGEHLDEDEAWCMARALVS